MRPGQLPIDEQLGYFRAALRENPTVINVLARAVSGRGLRVPEATRLGDLLVPAGRSWEFNQSMFDLGATVCTPPYLLGRLGLLMLGSKVLLIPGIFVFAIGITLQAGATGAVRAIKLSVSLTAGHRLESAPPTQPRSTL